MRRKGLIHKTVGVAVVNYQMPRFHEKKETILNCHSVARVIESAKQEIPGLDLIAFPEYSTGGSLCNYDEMMQRTMAIPGPETEIFTNACKKNQVWGVFSITGEAHEKHPFRTPYNTLVLISPAGQITQKYRKIISWTPFESWHPGNRTYVTEGPKGLKISLLIGDDGSYPSIWQDCSSKGAELVIRCQRYTDKAHHQQMALSRSMAAAGGFYVAAANIAGSDGTYHYPGCSEIINFDGRPLKPLELKGLGVWYATLSLSELREHRTMLRSPAAPHSQYA